MTLEAKGSSSNSKSDSTALLLLSNVCGGRAGSSPGSPGTSMAKLDQASRPYFRLYDCKSSELASPSSPDLSGSVLDGTSQHVLLDSR